MKKKRYLTLLVIILTPLLCLLFRPLLQNEQDPTRTLLADGALVRFGGALCCAALLWFCEYPLWRPTLGERGQHPFCATSAPFRLFLCFFALAVSVNNFPFSALFGAQASIVRADLLPLYALYCLSIGCFEEILFRGVLLPLYWERHSHTRKNLFLGIIGSSALFSLFHLFNLLEGASPASTLLQVGYSFLIGAMCAVVLLLTHSVLPCILLHTIFDFGGLLLSFVAQGKIWDFSTILVTALLGTATALLFFVWLCVVPPTILDTLFQRKKEKKESL